MSRTVVILQPSYLPWLGYFNQIAQADHFVFLDDVQYTRRDWRNRNYIKLMDGSKKLLTVPVKTKGKYLAKINEIEISYESNWIDRHLQLIQEGYYHTQHYSWYADTIAKALRRKYRLLADLDIRLTKAFSHMMGLVTSYHRSSQMQVDSTDPTGRLLDICKQLDARQYLTGASARNYLDEKQFEAAGITVQYQDYQHPVYPQVHGNFVPYLSIIDLLFNCGIESSSIISN